MSEDKMQTREAMLLAMDDRTEQRIYAASALTGIPAATLSALRSGEMVAVPREPTPDFWPSYCAANGAMPGSAWDTLSQKLYSAIIAHHARRSQGRAP